ncbi:MAG: OprO/OprP family phosphate-selective porin [Cytophagaceae bacterium]|jgi:hypothetical protein|nr:OprO/OprP family phosphate-selective porin [Cytophagaceae bacterium]
MKANVLSLTLLCLIAASGLQAQSESKAPIVSFKRGLGITPPDSSFSINFRFRIQNRAVYNTVSEDDFSAEDIEARVRRLRMRIEGFMLNPKLTYMIQLSFSRGDMDWSVRDNSSINNSPNVVRDAAMYYRPTKSLQLIFGQTKLPGNRQRVVSSGDQQFLDRSIVNATFNIDRDFGLHVNYFNKIGKFHYQIKSAISSGEGRNANISSAGLAYTSRLELLPLGEFTNKGDYFEGDLEREPKPKISLAGGLCYNERAVRTGGQLGNDLGNPANMTTFIYDGLIKYKGIAIYAEYMERRVDYPVTTVSGSNRIATNGSGTNIQASYIFKNNVELAARYAEVTPGYKTKPFTDRTKVYALNVTKYLKAHRVKLQGYLGYNQTYRYSTSKHRNFWTLGAQFELGI